MMLDGVFKIAGHNEPGNDGGGIAPPLDMMALLKALFPLPRSLTGDGVRATLQGLRAHIPLDIHEVATGTKVFDWDVPREWNIRGATIKTLDGRVLVDFANNNLHVVGYSVPVSGTFSREELARHIHTLPDQPDAIPYRTSYYAENWGFCLPHALWQTMLDESYTVEIDSTLADGALTYGELFVPGETDEEILISVHICHPSLANDNLSGIVVAAALAQHYLAKPVPRLGIRFLFLPATIGAITWLARNEDRLSNIVHGLVLTCIGDDGPFHYKKTVDGAVVDRAADHVLSHSGHAFEVMEFSPYGYDERQYGSPGIALPVGCLMRAVHGSFPEYHTSLDNCDFVTGEALAQSFRLLTDLIDLLQQNRTYARVDGRGEPQLGRRGLYRAIAGQKEAGGASQMDLLWVLNQCDGKRSLLDIADRAKAPFSRIRAAADLCLDAELITEVKP
jgi:aminopeptidase-like protein